MASAPSLLVRVFTHPACSGCGPVVQAAWKLREAHPEVELRTVQSNSEGALIDTIQQALTWANAILINPGAYSHYSIAIRDALAAVKLPTIEVHLTNIHGREEFRRRLMIAPACTGVICGIGWRGYTHALQALVQILQDRAGQSAT